MRDPVPELAWLRLVVAVLLVLDVGALARVCLLYWRAWRLLPATPEGRAAGLIPLHVALVSAGVLIGQVALAWGLIEQLRSDATAAVAVRTVLYGLQAVLVLAALVAVGRAQQRKVRFGRGCTRVTVADTQQVQVQLRPDKEG